jgi:inhibitor of cysteine peptidase
MTRRRWIALGVVVVLGIGLLVAIVAVPWGDDAPAVKGPPVYHQGDDISVAEGDEFVIAIAANPSTGYSWSAADNPDVTFESSRQVERANRPGAGGTQELTFRAAKQGTTTLVLDYTRPFEPDAPPAKSARFPVTVR